MTLVLFEHEAGHPWEVSGCVGSPFLSSFPVISLCYKSRSELKFFWSREACSPTGLGCITGPGLVQLPPPSVVGSLDVTSSLPSVPLTCRCNTGNQLYISGFLSLGYLAKCAISNSIGGRGTFCHGKILWNRVRKGRRQHVEIRTTKDRKMLKAINEHTHVN
jgi:hypothetical protein